MTLPYPGPPARPEGSAQAPGAAEAVSKQPGFDPLAEKRWNIISGGAQPYNGTAPVRCAQGSASCESLRLSNSLPKNRAHVFDHLPPPLCVWHAQTAAMARAAAELRKDKILSTASAPWEATKLRFALPLVLAQNATLEEGEQHVNVLAVRALPSSTSLLLLW